MTNRFGSLTCVRCGVDGHLSATCKQPNPLQYAVVQPPAPETDLLKNPRLVYSVAHNDNVVIDGLVYDVDVVQSDDTVMFSRNYDSHPIHGDSARHCRIMKHGSAIASRDAWFTAFSAGKVYHD